VNKACRHYKSALAILVFAFCLRVQLSAPSNLMAQALTNSVPQQSPDSPAAIAAVKSKALEGDANAQCRLGLMYEHGVGVPRDLAQAVAWYKRAAAQGNANGEYDLGLMYQYGTGVQQDYAQAITLYRQAAEQGHAEAENNIAVMYRRGLGVQQDNAQAFTWYQKAAAQGNAPAESNLGEMYQAGIGIQKDYAQAIAWYQKAAASGYPQAQADLGWMYQSGTGTQVDDVKALALYLKAAVLGNATAENNLGTMYQNGIGVQQNYAQAVAWYQKAAVQGNVNAESNLGWMYQNGLGIQKDDAQAVAWYQKAVAQGSSFATKNLDALNQQIASAGSNATTSTTAADSGHARSENDCDLPKDSGDGLAVFSSTLPPDFLWFNYTLHLASGKKKGIAVGQSQGASDFTDAYGRLFILRLPAGDYEFPTWQYQLNGSLDTTRPLHIHPLTFGIQSGRATYIGAFDPVVFQHKGGWIRQSADRAWVLVHDDHSRDLPVLFSKCPGLDRNLLDVKVMDTTPWLPPQKK
jgi:TPR repeat protein